MNIVEIVIPASGDWDSHHTWDFVIPRLAESFRVLTYDRRGYGESERSPGQGGVRKDIADLAGLIEHLGLAPVWLAGRSSGASVAFRLACERPDLLRGLIGHEPALLALLVDDTLSAPMLEQVMQAIGAVVERIASGDHTGAAEQLLDTVALGPGSWAQIPPEFQQQIRGIRTGILG